MKKGTLLYGIACFLLGALFFGGGVAYAAGVMAERSTNTVYVDGRRVELEAYLIDGSNYVKLRDVGQAVGFNVFWDGTVQIQSNAPYTGEAPVSATPQEQTPSTATTAYHEQAAPAIFNSAYTAAAYDALRECIVNGGDSAPVAMSAETYTAMMNATAAIGSYPGYDLKGNADGTTYFQTKYSSSYADAAKTCQQFLDALAGKSESDKLYAIACYICDRLEYDANSTATPRTLFASDSVKKGNCMSYANGLQFLCDLADIPCVFVHSAVHQWNEVYVGGRWYSVDLTSFDIGYTDRGSATLLHDTADMQGNIFKQTEPELTRFAKELLVPGSTK